MVYPQCLLNFIELLYSRGAAHCADRLRHFEEEGLTCSMFSTPPSDISSQKDPASERLSKPGRYRWISFPTCSALRVWKRVGSFAAEWTQQKDLVIYFFVHFVACAWTWWHVRSFRKRSVFFSVFNLRFFKFRSLYVCACVFFCIPPPPIWVASWSCAVTKMYITRSIVMFQGRVGHL